MTRPKVCRTSGDDAMANWKRRLEEARRRNPDAVPDWLRGPPAEPAWYRASWQTCGGVAAADAARPARLLLHWLALRGLLTSAGSDFLAAVEAGGVADVAVLRSHVHPRAAAFLDRSWEGWWGLHG